MASSGQGICGQIFQWPELVQGADHWQWELRFDVMNVWCQLSVSVDCKVAVGISAGVQECPMQSQQQERLVTLNSCLHSSYTPQAWDVCVLLLPAA